MSELINVSNLTKFQGIVDNLLKTVDNPADLREMGNKAGAETPALSLCFY